MRVGAFPGPDVGVPPETPANSVSRAVCSRRVICCYSDRPILRILNGWYLRIGKYLTIKEHCSLGLSKKDSFARGSGVKPGFDGKKYRMHEGCGRSR